MSITCFNIHDVTEVRAERRESRDGQVRWTEFEFIGAKGTILTVTTFAPEGYVAVEVEPADEDPDEPNEAEPRGAYEPIGYRADMVNAGRGHLLGE
jgi:hypothetical protein